MRGGFALRNSRTRTIAIAIAVILGLAALLYLGGLVCQLLTEYRIWLASGGMQGQSQIGDIQFGPFACWRHALTLSGLRYTGLVLLIGGSIYAFVRLYDRFGSRDFDDRNFARSQRGTYGTAGWMDEKELRRATEAADRAEAKAREAAMQLAGQMKAIPLSEGPEAEEAAGPEAGVEAENREEAAEPEAGVGAEDQEEAVGPGAGVETEGQEEIVEPEAQEEAEDREETADREDAGPR